MESQKCLNNQHGLPSDGHSSTASCIQQEEEVALEEESKEYSKVVNMFLLGMGKILASKIQILAISRPTTRPDLSPLKPLLSMHNQTIISKKDMPSLTNANANVNADSNIKMSWGWYGTTHEAASPLFRGQRFLLSTPLFSANRSSISAAALSPPNHEGAQHVILCRIIAKTIVLPLYLVTFKMASPWADVLAETRKRFNGASSTIPPASLHKGKKISKGEGDIMRILGPAIRSPWTRMPTLLRLLRRKLISTTVTASQLRKTFRKFQAHMISRKELVRKLREMVGQEILMEWIRILKAANANPL